MKQKNIGFALIAVTVILALTVAAYTIEIREKTMDSCPFMENGEECPHSDYIPWQTFMGGAMVLVLGIFSFFLITDENKTTETKRTAELKKVATTLKGDQRKLYDMIINGDGAVLQSDLVDDSDFNKVKVSRLLDKLEGKGLIERKRRGMTNLVVAK